jgi:hypothetical protein
VTMRLEDLFGQRQTAEDLGRAHGTTVRPARGRKTEPIRE